MEQEKDKMPSLQPLSGEQTTATGQTTPQQQVSAAQLTARQAYAVEQASKARSAQARASERRKRRFAILGLVFLLFLIIFIVPVERIPGVNRLAGWMGLSPEEAGRLSIGRAIFALLQKEREGTLKIGGKNHAGQDEFYSLFDKQAAAKFNPNGPQSGLFDQAAVNAARRARGLGPDNWGRFVSAEDEDPDAPSRGAVGYRVRDWSAAAKREAAARAARAEVYFGKDVAAAERGKGISTKTQIGPGWTRGGGNIVGSAGTSDWLGMSIDKAWELSVGKDLDKNLSEAANMKLPIGGNRLVAGSKPAQDLAQVWLLSKAAQRPSQLMLRKQLAQAGYVAMEMPRTVYDSFGKGDGVLMTQFDLMADFQETNKQFLKDEDCVRLGEQVSATLQPLQQNMIGKVQQVRENLPTGCDDVGAWSESLTQLQTSCQQANDALGNFEAGCGRSHQPGSCQTVRLTDHANTITDACTNLANAENELANVQAQLATYEGRELTPEEQEAKDALEAQKNTLQNETIPGFNTAIQNEVDSLTQEEVDNTFNAGSGDSEGGAGCTDGNCFFPTVGMTDGWYYD